MFPASFFLCLISTEVVFKYMNEYRQWLKEKGLISTEVVFKLKLIGLLVITFICLISTEVVFKCIHSRILKMMMKSLILIKDE